MTRDDIIRMARESGMLIPSFRSGGGLALGTCTIQDFERFAELVAAAEREACATPPGHAKWHFKQVEMSGTVAARAPDGREFVVKGGDFDTNAGRELLNAMIAALSGS